MNDDLDHSRYVGFDLGGTKMLAALFDGAWNVVARGRKKSKGAEGAKAGVRRIVQTVQELLAESGTPAEQLLGIGLGCPGPVNLETGEVLEAVNLGWRNVPLRAALEKEFGCRVDVLNDVDAGVYGESQLGAGRGARTVLGVFPGTGIGGGCVYAGEILHGRGISCLEIGHVQVRPEGRRCGCGQRGCLETEASRLAIAGEAAKAALRGEAPRLLEIAGADLAEIRSGALAKSIAAGDKAIERIVREAARWVGVAVAGCVHLLAPDVVVLGGGLVESMPELWVEAVGRAARQRVMPAYADTFEVRAAKLGDDATALGAAAWSRRQHVLCDLRERAPAAGEPASSDRRGRSSAP